MFLMITTEEFFRTSWEQYMLFRNLNRFQTRTAQHSSAFL